MFRINMGEGILSLVRQLMVKKQMPPVSLLLHSNMIRFSFPPIWIWRKSA